MGNKALWNYMAVSLKNKTQGFPGGSVVKNLPANAGDMSSSPHSGDMSSSPDPGRSHLLHSS